MACLQRGRPVGCPATDRQRRTISLNLEGPRVACVKHCRHYPVGYDISIFRALEERVDEGLDHESRMGEVAFNRTLKRILNDMKTTMP